MQIGTPFSGMPRSSSAGMQRNIRSFTTSAVCVPWADRRAFLIWFPIYALWTRCPSTGWVGGSTVPKRWLPAVTAVTLYIWKKKRGRWFKCAGKKGSLFFGLGPGKENTPYTRPGKFRNQEDLMTLAEIVSRSCLDGLLPGGILQATF